MRVKSRGWVAGLPPPVHSVLAGLDRAEDQRGREGILKQSGGASIDELATVLPFDLRRVWRPTEEETGPEQAHAD